MLNTGQEQAVSCNARKILCLAGAGTGKTHSMISRISRLVNEQRVKTSEILVLTFTNAAAYEMKERYRKVHKNQETPMFCTFHSFCYSLICENQKAAQYLGYYQGIPQIADDMAIRKLRTMCRQQCGTKISDDKLDGKVKITKSESFQKEIYWKQFNKLMKEQNLITFDYMCYGVCDLFKSDSPLVKEYKKKFKYIFVDEFQDTDPKQWEFVSSFKNSDLFVVGDAKQCQPAGTMVTMLDGSKKAIESLMVGDYVLSYNVRDGRFPKLRKPGYGKRITAISSNIDEKIYKIKAGNLKSRYTPNHITYARVHYTGNEDKYVVYLMTNEKGWWRVGSTKLFAYKTKSDFGVCCRMRSEHATAVWILDVVDSAQEAWIIEQTVAYKFGIPQMTWIHNNVRFSIDEMTRLYSELGDLYNVAAECLHFYNRDIKYPFYIKNGESHFSKEHIFEIYVCNLITGVMDIAAPYKNENGKWKLNYRQIDTIEIDTTPTTVYSLDVEENHNYVADGILTHNSIYGFRGADSSIIISLAENPEWKTIKLSQNYRSTNEICEYSNKIHDNWKGSTYNLNIIGQKSGMEVIVRRELNLKINKEVLDIVSDCADKKTVVVLCRTNYEVSDIKEKFKSLGISFNSKDTNADVGSILKSAVDSEYLVDWLSNKLHSVDYNNYLKFCSIDSRYKTESGFIELYQHTLEKYIKVIIKIREILKNEEFAYGKITAICKLLNIKTGIIKLSSDDDKGIIEYLIQLAEFLFEENGIYVGTIHSVKGLEFDCVHLIGVNGKSFPVYQSEEQQNVFYVGCTRAKEKLVIYDSDCIF